MIFSDSVKVRGFLRQPRMKVNEQPEEKVTIKIIDHVYNNSASVIQMHWLIFVRGNLLKGDISVEFQKVTK